MKILINFLQSHSGGARSYLRNILPYINQWPNQENLTVYVLLYQQQLDADKIDMSQLNIKLIIIDTIPKFKPLTEQWIVRKNVRQIGIDILFTPYQFSLKFKGVKSISMLRNMEVFLHWNYSSVLTNRLRNIVLCVLSTYTLKNSDLVIAVSDFAKQYMMDNLKIQEKNILRIYHGRDLNFSPNESVADDAVLAQFGLRKYTYLFTSGSFLPYRKLETLIDAFVLSADTHNFKLVIAGDGNDKNYKKLISNQISSSGIKDRIIPLGFIDIKEMQVLYRHAHLYITATEVEACPNIAIEAMSSGCSVIAANKPPLPEMFGNKAVYFNAGDSLDLANKINDFIKTPFTISPDGYRLDRFSWPLCASAIFEAIKSLKN